jgi:hypothetical protein
MLSSDYARLLFFPNGNGTIGSSQKQEDKKEELMQQCIGSSFFTNSQ